MLGRGPVLVYFEDVNEDDKSKPKALIQQYSMI